MKRALVRWCFCAFVSGFGGAGGLSQQPGNGPDGWVEVLRNDACLKVSVTLKSESWPTPAALLEMLQKATGVPLSWAGEGDKDKVILGTTAAVNVPAWKIMQQLAVTQVTGGKWEKTGDGYELHGTPKQFGPAAEYARSEKGKAAIATMEEKRTDARKRAEDFAKFHPLAADLRLRARLKLVATQPPMADVFALLAKATGLEFTLAENLAAHSPDMGELALPNVAAYSVMEIIAQRDIEDGRWEKTESGYRLFGKSLVPLPPSPPTRWPIVAAVVAAGILCTGFLIVRYRRLPRRLS
jgi:hypothetical protein